MKIALIGATGMIGQRILNEALSRGHRVIAIARNPAKIEPRPNLEVKTGDVMKPETLIPAITTTDVLVSSCSPPHDNPREAIDSVRTLTEAVATAAKAGNHSLRLIMVGGASSLEIAPGVQLLDSPNFPEAWKPVASAHREALGALRKTPINWTYFSPAAFIQPGTRTGKYRVGSEQLVTDAKGESRISAEDYAVAMLDEIEKPCFVRQRFTAAY
jgi:putative NADH-flavin reductase